MKNQDFINSRQSILAGESMAFVELEDDKFLKTIDSRKIDKIAGIEFVKWKQGLLNLIKNSDEKALQERLKILKSKLCNKCRKGLKTGNCIHQREYKTFIACAWIIEALR